MTVRCSNGTMNSSHSAYGYKQLLPRFQLDGLGIDNINNIEQALLIASSTWLTIQYNVMAFITETVIPDTHKNMQHYQCVTKIFPVFLHNEVF